jgi:hypothetical protein
VACLLMGETPISDGCFIWFIVGGSALTTGTVKSADLLVC